MGKSWPDFVLEFSTPDGLAASPVSLGTASLDHKSSNHSVEKPIVIITVLGVCRKVFHRLGALVTIQFKMDLAH